MNKTLATIIFVLAAAILLVLLGNPFYVVKEGTQVVITRFGEPVRDPVTNAGIHMKLPFVEHISRFEKRLLEWDGDPNEIPTKDKRFIWIDTTARWRINDPLKFLKSVGDEIGAQARLDDILDSVTRDAITKRSLIEIVRSTNRPMTANELTEDGESNKTIKAEKIRSGRNELTREILSKAKEMTGRYGIELVDIRIKRIIYINNVLEKIYERMIAERRKAAEQFRSEGQGRQAEIEGQVEKELNVITSEAYKKSQQIKGEADAEAARIYAEAYEQDKEFYNFLKTLQTYENSIDKKSTLLLTTDSEYFSLLKEYKAINKE